MTFKEHFEHNFTLGVLSVALGSFVAGFAAYKAVATHGEKDPATTVQKLQHVLTPDRSASDSREIQVLREELSKMRNDTSSLALRLGSVTESRDALVKEMNELRVSYQQLTEALASEKEASKRLSDSIRKGADAVGAFSEKLTDPTLRHELRTIQIDLAIGKVNRKNP